MSAHAPETRPRSDRTRPTRLLGLVLWRFGLLLAGSYTFLRGARLALRYVDLPPQLELGCGLVLAGAGLVLASVVAERIQDLRTEGDLSR